MFQKVSRCESHAIPTVIEGTDCTYDTLLATFVDFNRQNFNAAMVFSPEEKVEIVLFWYERKL